MAAMLSRTSPSTVNDTRKARLNKELSWERDPEEVKNISLQACRLGTDQAERYNFTQDLPGRTERPDVNLVIEEDGINDQPGQGQGNGRTLTELAVITLPMSSGFGVEQLTITRDEYYSSLMKEEFVVRKNNKLQKESFSVEDAAQMTNLFFSDLIGPEAVKRVGNIIKYYNRPNNSTAQRAEKLSYSDIPLKEFREFFRVYSKVQRARNGTGSVFFKFQRTVWRRELLQCFRRLRQMAEDKHPVLLTILADRKYYPTRGYLADSLNLDQNALKNACQEAYGIAELVEHYGLGIIPILPPNAGDRLNKKCGNQRAPKACELFKKRLPDLQAICDILEEHLYIPLRNEQPLNMRPPKLGPNGSLQSKLEEAIIVRGVTGQQEISDTDASDDDMMDVEVKEDSI